LQQFSTGRFGKKIVSLAGGLVPAQQSVHCGRWGFCCTYGKHFSGFEFFLLPNRIHARPSASNANRWAAWLVLLYVHMRDIANQI